MPQKLKNISSFKRITNETAVKETLQFWRDVLRVFRRIYDIKPKDYIPLASAMAKRTDISFFSDQGGLPEIISNTVQPRLHISAYLLWPLYFMTSGAIQYGVPQKVL